MPKLAPMMVLQVLAHRGIGLVFGLLLSVALSRGFGSDGVGLFYVYVAVTQLGARVLGAGLPVHTLRGVAGPGVRGDAAAQRRYLARMLWIAGGIHVPIAVGLLLFADALAPWLFGSSDYAIVLRAGGVGQGFMAVLAIVAAALKGAQRPRVAVLLEFAVVPMVLLGGVVAAVWGAGSEFGIGWVMTAHAALLALAAAAGLLAWRTGRSAAQPIGEPPPQSSPGSTKKGYRGALTVWMLVLTNVGFSWLPYVIVPHFVSQDEVGLFAVAHRLAAAGAAVVMALSGIYAPRFAAAHIEGDAARLRHDLRGSQAYSMLGYLPFCVIFLLLAEPLLALFGPEFIAAKFLLWTLMAGFLVDAALGLNGVLLNMIYREDLGLLGAAFAMILLIGLTAYLASAYGAWGVAVAYTLALAARNIVCYTAAMNVTRRLLTTNRRIPEPLPASRA